MTGASPRFRRAALSVALSFAVVRGAFAHRDDYINETFVFQTLEAGEFEPELWLESAGETASQGSFRAIAGAFEYGITDHWMVDGFARWLDMGGVEDSFQRFRAETRVRFGEEGDRPVDLAASFEIEYEEADEEEPGEAPPAGTDWAWTMTPRLVLSRDLGSDFNATLNLDLSRRLGANVQDRWAPGYAVA